MADVMDRPVLFPPEAASRPCALSLAFYLPDLAGGGAERMTLTLIAELLARGARVTLLLGRAEGALAGQAPDGCEVIAFGTRRTAADLPRLVRFLRRRRPDVLLSAINHNNLLAMAARLIARTPARLVISFHNALSAEAGPGAPLGYRVLPHAYRLLARAADGVVAVSRGVADDAAAATGIARARISVLYNPVIDARFAEAAAAPADHPWLREPVPVFVTAGRLTAQKDHATLLRAMALRLRQGPARLLILGDGPERAALERQARALGIAGSVAFLGFVANPLPYVRQASAFVLSSRYEGFGLVLVEALGCGTPVISTDCTYGPSEILADGAYGTLTPVGDADALAIAMGIDQRDRWPASRLRARAAEFSASRSADGYIALMDRILAEARR